MVVVEGENVLHYVKWKGIVRQQEMFGEGEYVRREYVWGECLEPSQMWDRRRLEFSFYLFDFFVACIGK